MTIHFDLMPLDVRAHGGYRPTRLKLSMSNANAARMLQILGIEAPVDEAGFIPNDLLGELLQRATQARTARLEREDRAVRYELPRLEQFEVLFAEALKKGYGVLMARTSDD
jgi:hypothetical protein